MCGECIWCMMIYAWRFMVIRDGIWWTIGECQWCMMMMCDDRWLIVDDWRWWWWMMMYGGWWIYDVWCMICDGGLSRCIVMGDDYVWLMTCCIVICILYDDIWYMDEWWLMMCEWFRLTMMYDGWRVALMIYDDVCWWWVMMVDAMLCRCDIGRWWVMGDDMW